VFTGALHLGATKDAAVSQPTPPFFVFDGACGFCEKWVWWLGRRVPDRVTFVPYQAIDDLARFGLAVPDVQRASYWIDDRGHRYRGNRSIAHVLKQAAGLWKLAGIVIDLPVIRVLAAVAYFGISRNRHRLPAPLRP
jgi:predicted DCC family thiol-disulfide oxidoreductase YuxK